jgi:hypothetical protein
VQKGKLSVTFVDDVDSKPLGFNAEECALRSAVDRFNNRRYDRGVGEQDRKDVLEWESSL